VTNRPHEHVLRTLGDLAVELEQVRPLEGLETTEKMHSSQKMQSSQKATKYAQELVVVVPVVDNSAIQLILVLHDDLIDVVGNHGGILVGLGVLVLVQVRDDVRKGLLRLLVQVRDGDTGSENRIVGMPRGL